MRLIGLAKSTHHYRRRPRPGRRAPVPHRDRHQPHALTAVETDAVAAVITAGVADGVSVEQAHLAHLDAGPVLASASTFQRVARTRELRPVRRPRPGRPAPLTARTVPSLTASRPDQVYCWDITFLPGLMTRESFALYSVIDLYSRMIVAHTVQPRENQVVATTLLAGAIDAAAGRVETLHSDNGAAMKSMSVSEAMTSRQVAQSFIRPGVSNDNPHIESFFKTLKHGRQPVRPFDGIHAAKAWIDAQIAHYNQHHRHSALAGFTPHQVHTGTWAAAARDRQDRLTEHYHAHPGRYRRPPVINTPPTIVTINAHNTGERLALPPLAQTLLTG